MVNRLNSQAEVTPIIIRTTINTNASAPFDHAQEGTTTPEHVEQRYRTRKKAGEVDELPQKITIISIDPYCCAISFRKNAHAYIELKDKSRPIPDTMILQYIYGVFLAKYDGKEDLNNNISGEWTQKTITIYLPDLLRKIKKRDKDAVLGKLIEYRNLEGVFPGDELCGTLDQRSPVIGYYKYDQERNTVTISSPYIQALIHRVQEARIAKKKLYPKKYRGESLPPGYSFRIDPGIIGERCVRAAEVVCVITTLIEKAGSPLKKDRKGKLIRDENGNSIIDKSKIAHISNGELIRRCDRLSLDYHAADRTTSQNKMLKDVFGKAWDFLVRYTDLQDVYKDIKLPEAKDKRYIPTSSRLDEVLEFPHYGKNRKN